MKRALGAAPLQIHRLTSDDEIAKVVPVNDWGSIFDKEEEVKSLGYEGYLYKKAQKMGGLPSRWVKRYFLFDEEKSLLLYWGTKGEKDKMKPRGSYQASDFLTVVIPDPARQTRFDVKLKDKYGDRLLSLRADKDFEARQWVESIRKHVAMEVAKAQSAEEKEFVGAWTAGKTIEMMNKGQKMVAYFSNGDRRAIKLFCRSLCIYVCHVNGTPNQPILQIPLRSVTDIYVGKQTPGFSTGVATDVAADRCFSVKSKQYTVDVEAPTAHQALGWLKGLQYLLTNSGKSVLYDEDAELQAAAGGSNDGSGPDLQTPPKKKSLEGEPDEAQPPPLTPASPGDEKSGNSKKRKGAKTASSPTSPAPASPGPSPLDRSPLGSPGLGSPGFGSPLGSPVFGGPGDSQLLDRLHAAEKERDGLRERIEELTQQGSAGASRQDDYNVPATLVLPSLASLLERYRVLTVEELPAAINAFSQVLASQKGKKNSKRHYRKAGTALTKAMEECWKRTHQYLTGLTGRAVAMLGKTEIAEGKAALSPELKEKYIMRVFLQFMGYLNPDLHPFPATQLANEVLQSLGKFQGYADAEKTIKDFLIHTFQMWWAFILAPNSEVRPMWKEEFTADYYTLITDQNVKDGSIRFPPLLTTDGRVLYRGEARPVRKDNQKDKGSKKK